MRSELGDCDVKPEIDQSVPAACAEPRSAGAVGHVVTHGLCVPPSPAADSSSDSVHKTIRTHLQPALKSAAKAREYTKLTRVA